jgi:putative hydroxymethylpyrimidine transport system substrate-binding protein
MKSPVKRSVLAFLGFGLIAIAVACGSSSDDDELTSVSLALDWFANSNHAGIYEAVNRGYFLEEGLDVKVYTPADPSTVLQTVGAGRDDFGISYQPDLLLARSANVPVVSVMGLVQHPLNSVMALSSSGIDSPGDLKGLKVGHPNIPSNQGMLATMLAEEGLTLDDVELVDVGFLLVEALLGGRVDAIVGAYWTHESIRIEMEGEPVNIMRMEEWGVPDFYELVLTTSEKTLEDRPEIVERFVRAMRRGFEAANADPQGSIDTLVELNPDTVNEELERRGVDVLQPMWTEGAPSIGWQERERWESFSNWMKSQGFIGDEVDPNKAFTNQFAAN